MNPLTLSVEQSRQVDTVAIRQYGINGLVLMENAGREASRWIAGRIDCAVDVCILCGKGNNAGDGYVIARHLQCDLAARADTAPPTLANVRIVTVVDPAELRGDAAVNQSIARAAEIPIDVAVDAAEIAGKIGTPDVVIDCLLGTGAVGPPRGLIATAIRVANSLAAWRVAIDVPSGLDADSGISHDPTFHAAATLTFVALKSGFETATAAEALGEVVVLPIGIPWRLLRQLVD